MTPAAGQAWQKSGGGIYRILDARGKRVLALSLDTGNREWFDASDFISQHRPIKPMTTNGGIK